MFLDGSNILRELRMTKSEAEINRVEKICIITSEALDKTFDTIKGDMNETEIRKILFTNMIKYGADKPHGVSFSTPSDTKFKESRSLVLDAGAIYKGYNSDISRTAFIGKPTDEQKKDFERAREATEACIKMFKPGIKAYEIHKACPIQVPLLNRIGHGVGRERTEPPSLDGYDETILKPGMVLCIEPAINKQYGKIKIEDMIVITEDGCRILSTSKKVLWEI
jgi:Xaa-Pro aminopeptidase